MAIRNPDRKMQFKLPPIWLHSVIAVTLHRNREKHGVPKIRLVETAQCILHFCAWVSDRPTCLTFCCIKMSKNAEWINKSNLFFHLLRLRCSLSMLLHSKAFIANAKIPHKHRQIQIFQPLDIAPPLFSSFENSRKALYLQALPPPFSAIQQSEIGICFQGFHHAAHQTTVSIKNKKPLSRTLHTTPATSPHSAPLQNITQTK